MRAGRRRVLVASTLFSVGVAALSGCGVVQDPFEGVIGQGSTSQPSHPSSPQIDGLEDLTVTITVESDADTSGELSVEIDSPGSGQSLHEESVSLPFDQDFAVAMDSPLPLRDTRVEVDAGPGASYIECSIILNGEAVASHRAEGSAATATCDRGLQVGPS